MLSLPLNAVKRIWKEYGIPWALQLVVIPLKTITVWPRMAGGKNG
jgi:hypothetical protein